MSGVTAIDGNVANCAILQDRTVQCWGVNLKGQLGDGTLVSRVNPAPVVGLDDVVEISLGGAHSCVRIGDGTVRCWGENSYGEVGDGTGTDTLVPVAVPGLSSVRQIAAGSHHTCAVSADGRVWCWGNNGYGALGDGTTKDRLLPTLVVSLSNVRSIATGTTFTCALLEDRFDLLLGRQRQGSTREWDFEWVQRLDTGDLVTLVQVVHGDNIDSTSDEMVAALKSLTVHRGGLADRAGAGRRADPSRGHRQQHPQHAVELVHVELGHVDLDERAAEPEEPPHVAGGDHAVRGRPSRASPLVEDLGGEHRGDALRNAAAEVLILRLDDRHPGRLDGERASATS